MKKILRLTESQLVNLIKSTLNEQSTTILSKGDRGNDVIDLQNVLKKFINSRKLNISLGNSGPNSDGVDGVFGKKTETAVKEIQKTFGISPANGVVDIATKNLISSYETGNKLSSIVPQFGIKKVKTTTKEPVKDTKKIANYKYSPRIDAELNFIVNRYEKMQEYNDRTITKLWNDKPEQLKGFGKPFFIYDPKFNLLYLFDEKYQYVAHTSVVDGADMQRSKEESKIFKYSDWCAISGLKSTPHLCTNSETNKKQNPDYKILASYKTRFLPKGIYTISALVRQPGYTGKGINQYSLKDDVVGSIPNALHGVPDLPNPSGKGPGRLQASAELEVKLKNDLNSQQVPPEYFDAISTIANANQSSGCVGIPAKFIENPKVVEKVQVGCAVFVIGEGDESFLVQNSNDFFEKLGGDGENCQSPNSLAKQFSSTA